MNKSIYGKGINCKIWHYNYCYKKIINIYKYFNIKELLLLQKIGINIENKLYSEREFDTFNELLYSYYQTTESKIIKNTFFNQLGISQNIYIKFLNIFNKISNDYKL